MIFKRKKSPQSSSAQRANTSRDYARVTHREWAKAVEIDLDSDGHDRLEIGSSPDCWLTLPDPDLPDVVGVIHFESNQIMLRDLQRGDFARASEIDLQTIPARQVDRSPFTIGDYRIQIIHQQ